MTTTKDALPELPKPAILWRSDHTNQTYYGYTKEHMRDYALAALASKQAPAESGEWHAPGLGEVHAEDHKQMIYCEAEDEAGEMVVSDALAKRVAALLSAQAKSEPAASDARDAARYRWLRDNTDSDWAICEWNTDESDGIGYYRDARAPNIVDAAVDAAIAATQGETKA